MEECEKCKDNCEHSEEISMPNIVINITYNDNRVNKDESNYIDNVTMDSED